MTDFPRVAPPPDGLQLAMAAARRRRWRVASLTTTAGASLALVVPLLLGGGGQSVLVPEPDPQQPAVKVSHSPAHHAVPNVATSSASAPAVAPVTHQLPTTTLAQRQPPARSSADGRPYAAGPITREDNVYASFGTICFRADGSKPTGLCTAVRSNRDGQPGTVFQADLCNVDATPATVRFPSSQEVDFVVRSSKGGEVWRWSHWHAARPVPHTLTVAPSACDHWNFRWSEVDLDGHRLPAGNYTLSVSYGAAGLDAANTTFSL